MRRPVDVRHCRHGMRLDRCPLGCTEPAPFDVYVSPSGLRHAGPPKKEKRVERTPPLPRSRQRKRSETRREWEAESGTGCWFCRSTHNAIPHPDGAPLCSECFAELEAFRAWLKGPIPFRRESTGCG